MIRSSGSGFNHPDGKTFYHLFYRDRKTGRAVRGRGGDIRVRGVGDGGEGFRWDKILRSRVQSPDGTTFYHFWLLRY